MDERTRTTIPPEHRATEAITVADVMHHGVVTAPRDASLSFVAELMANRRVHSVVVADDPDDAASLWGVVSDLDLVAAASVRDLADQTAGGTAATAALTIAPDEPLRRAVQLMTEHGVAHLIVVDPVRRYPVGVVSTLDVAAALAPDGRAARRRPTAPPGPADDR